MKTIVKLKHWQLFLVTLFPILFSNFVPFDQVLIRSILPFFSLIILFFWMFSIVQVLSKEVLREKSINKTYYLSSYLVIMIIWIVIYLLNESSIYNTGSSINSNDGVHFWVVLILGLYSLWSIFYIYYFTARIISLANIEFNPKEGSVTTNYFLAFWFYVIGIWFVQSKVNEILSQNEMAITATKRHGQTTTTG